MVIACQCKSLCRFFVCLIRNNIFCYYCKITLFFSYIKMLHNIFSGCTAKINGQVSQKAVQDDFLERISNIFCIFAFGLTISGHGISEYHRPLYDRQ